MDPILIIFLVPLVLILWLACKLWIYLWSRFIDWLFEKVWPHIKDNLSLIWNSWIITLLRLAIIFIPTVVFVWPISFAIDHICPNISERVRNKVFNVLSVVGTLTFWGCVIYFGAISHIYN